MAETLHFTLDRTAGALIMSIAQEHLLYDNNYEKAIKTITDSCTGIPMNLAIELLHGTKCLIVVEDEDNPGQQYFELCSREDAPTDIEFPKLDCKYFAKRQLREINSQVMFVRPAIQRTMFDMQRDRTFTHYFSYDSIFEFIAGNSDAILDDLRTNNEELEALTMLVITTKKFIEKSSRTFEVIHAMRKLWPEDFVWDEEKNTVDFDVDEDYSEARHGVRIVAELLKDLIKQNYDVIEFQQDNVKAYIDATREIDQIIEKGIEPVDIMDNYSAGWLAPDGTYYALNGEYANNLHNQIAVALFEKGLIPDEGDNKNNPDNWLLRKGWARIHENNVLFEGNLNEKYNLGSRNVYLTDVQIDKITDYCRTHYRQVVKLMFQEVSALMFQMQAKSGSPAFYKKYFMGD